MEEIGKRRRSYGQYSQVRIYMGSQNKLQSQCPAESTHLKSYHNTSRVAWPASPDYRPSPEQALAGNAGQHPCSSSSNNAYHFTFASISKFQIAIVLNLKREIPHQPT
jgi:hypothetical protein